MERQARLKQINGSVYTEEAANNQMARVEASLNTLKSMQERERQYIRAGGWYMLEIVRPDTAEARTRWALDGTRNINGTSREVSRQKMYVASVRYATDAIHMDCRGLDNFARRENGDFTYYQVPLIIHQSETFVLSVTRA